MKRKWFLIIGLVIIIFFSINIFNDYRAKGLDDLISFNSTDFDSFVFNEGHEHLEVRTDKKEHAEKLDDFLSQYRVKRMNDNEWDSDVSEEEGFMLTIYSKNKPIMASIYERRVHFLNEGKYYNVLNGPIDMDWVNNYIQEYQ
ncbi:hypothetical protein [Alkalihalobacterium chitinilyticum]|uniref:Uncharacterized protein n=1 Tax=Alkalihalobacterium chitinilyticum TaxID=2980103 RepID=A0ABT5VKI3_9BACI|nr:hypothetical protein [Alkalihalobacterium chitinilyticum]MDE5415257.1 hypothetical protein [Alkalihalobacterium chitinilyticum]